MPQAHIKLFFVHICDRAVFESATKLTCVQLVKQGATENLHSQDRQDVPYELVLFRKSICTFDRYFLRDSLTEQI
jgi:hypothetical protein